MPNDRDKTSYSAKQGQVRADSMKRWKGRNLKIDNDKKLFKYLEKRIADDKFSPDTALGEIREAFYTLFKSIPMDNGTEFVDQQALESSCLKIGLKRTTCYSAHPDSSQVAGKQ